MAATRFATCSLLLLVVILHCRALEYKDRNYRLYRVVCFHVGDSFYRLGNGKFSIEDIDASLCTHLVYGYSGVFQNKIRSLDGYLDHEENFGRGNYRRIKELREKHPTLTTLLSVGGKSEGSIKFSELAKDNTKRREFVQSCLDYLDLYGFDGLDLNWQYPAHKGGVPEDKQHFTILLQDLRNAFKEKDFVLTATVAGQKDVIESAYEVDKVSRLVDFLNVVAYDFRQGNEKRTGLEAPLYSGAAGDTEGNADFALRYWMEKGASPDKLVLSLSCYGQTWTLASATGKVQPPGSNATGPGESWSYTRESGIIGYNEFCESQKEVDWIISWLDKEKASFATQGDQWISYDDPNSVKEKSKYVLDHMLGGVLLHGIESDDGRGLCSDVKFPMVTAAYEILHGEARPTTPNTPPTPSTSSTTTSTAPPPVNFQCTYVGFFGDPAGCSDRYFQCIHRGHFEVISYYCGPGLIFDDKIKICNWKHMVSGC